jgi:hypothetical protein
MVGEGLTVLVEAAATDIWGEVVLRVVDANVVVELVDVDVVVPGAADAEVIGVVRGIRGAADLLVVFGILLEVVLLKEKGWICEVVL